MTEGTRVDFLEKNNASFHTHLEGHHVRLQEQVGTSHDSHLDPVLRTSWSVGARQLSYSLCEQVVLTKCFHQPLSHTRRFPCRLIVVTGDGIKITFQGVKLVIPQAKDEILELRNIFLDLMFKTDKCLGGRDT
jgi:hypothetical protein